MQAGLPLCCSQTPEDRFSRIEPQLQCMYVVGTQKDRLWETVLLSTHRIYFDIEIILNTYHVGFFMYSKTCVKQHLSKRAKIGL